MYPYLKGVNVMSTRRNDVKRKWGKKNLLALMMLMVLAISIFAGCAKPELPEDTGSKTEQAEDTGKEEEVKEEEAALPTPEPTPDAPEGPFELNQVIYDENGTKITALSYEDRLSGSADQGTDIDPVLDLSLRVEKTGDEPHTLYIEDFSVNGFGSDMYTSFLIWSDPERMDWLQNYSINVDGTYEFKLSATRSFADSIGLESAGNIGMLIGVKTDEQHLAYKNIRLDLGQEAVPSADISVIKEGNAYNTVLVKADNPLDKPMAVKSLIRYTSTEGAVIYPSGFNYMTGEEFQSDAGTDTFFVKNGAKDMLCSVNGIKSRPVFEDGSDVMWRDFGDAEVEFVSAIPSDLPDLSDTVSFESEGRSKDSSNFVIFRCTWPDEYQRLQIYGTGVCYNEDGTIYKIYPIESRLLKDKDYRDNYRSANSETGWLDYFVIDCKKEGDGPDYTFKAYLSYVCEVQGD